MDRFCVSCGDNALAGAKVLHSAVVMEISDDVESAQDYVLSYDQHGVGDLTIAVSGVA